MNSVSPEKSHQERLFQFLSKVLIPNLIATLCSMKSMVYISSTMATISMIIPNLIYHIFLSCTLFAFLGSFSSMMVQHKPRVERDYAVDSMISALRALSERSTINWQDTEKDIVDSMISALRALSERSTINWQDTEKDIVDRRPVPVFFRGRATIYHIFLSCTLFAFLGSFSSLRVQHKPRVERDYDVHSMISALRALSERSTINWQDTEKDIVDGRPVPVSFSSLMVQHKPRVEGDYAVDSMISALRALSERSTISWQDTEKDIVDSMISALRALSERSTINWQDTEKDIVDSMFSALRALSERSTINWQDTEKDIVDGRPVPVFFRGRATIYHIFLSCTLFVFLGSFSSLMVQHKPRVERDYAVHSMISALRALSERSTINWQDTEKDIVDRRPVPVFFRGRAMIYHIFLSRTLFAFLGSFSSLMVQHKPRVERDYAVDSMISALRALSERSTINWQDIEKDIVDGRPVPVFFRGRAMIYHIFLSCTLFGFLGSFSSLMVQHKPRVERDYAVDLVISALNTKVYLRLFTGKMGLVCGQSNSCQVFTIKQGHRGPILVPYDNQGSPDECRDAEGGGSRSGANQAGNGEGKGSSSGESQGQDRGGGSATVENQGGNRNAEGSGSGDEEDEGNRQRRVSSDREQGRQESNQKENDISGIPETFMAIIGAVTIAVVDFHSSGAISSTILRLVIAINVFGFLCCMTAMLHKHRKPRAARIFAIVGAAAAGLALLLLVSVYFSSYSGWLILGLGSLAILVICVWAL